MALFFAAALGAALGSFLGVVIDRNALLLNPYFLLKMGRSRCRHCKHRLAWWENIPILSFILLGGRCRKCRAAIPYWLPLVELAGAAAAVAIAAQMRHMSLMGLMGFILIAAALIWIFFSDLVKGLVPDWAVGIGAAGAVLSQISQIGLISLIWPIAAASAAAGFFWFLAKATAGKGMGTGDITLAFFLGLWLGWPKILVAIWLGFLLGAVIAIGLIVSKRKKLGQTVPFGPFLIAGAIVAKIWGLNLLELLLTI